jgi:DNA-binding transcriptional LysR family regulator
MRMGGLPVRGGLQTVDWDKLRIFHAVADAGSFTHAGDKLKLSQSAVSRQISALEESLNVTLFHRHARGLILTEQGELLLSTARDVFNKLASIESKLTETKDTPQGPLTVTTTVAFGSTWLVPRLGLFMDRYPDIKVSLIVEDRELDLGMREADVAIRLNAPRQPDLIARNLFLMDFHVYAGVDYLKQNGVPKNISDLVNHRLVGFASDVPAPIPNINWLFSQLGDMERRLTRRFDVNSIYGMAMAVRSGLGIAALPAYMTTGDDSIARVLPELEGPTIQAYFCYPEELRNSKRIAVFRDFMIEQLQGSGFKT